MSEAARVDAQRLRVLRDAPGDAAWNMAVDAALLERGGPPTLRLYGWRPDAVSLGYFQRADDFADVVAAGTRLVRRSTGGGAIHHDDELTFSLALDASLLPRDVRASYALLHDVLVAALRDLGVRCRRAAAGGDQRARPGHRWCFAAPVVDDLVTERGKLCGSAQRRVRRPHARVLHHGSLVLRRPSWTPFVAAVEDQVEPDNAFVDALCGALAAGFAGCLGLGPAPGALDEAERALAAQLVSGRYGSDAFVRRR